MTSACIVLDHAGLHAAQTLYHNDPRTLILAPACVADRCSLARILPPDPNHRIIQTDNPRVLAWVGPLRFLELALAQRFDQITALIPANHPPSVLTRALPSLAAAGRLAFHRLPPASNRQRSEPGGAGPSAGA